MKQGWRKITSEETKMIVWVPCFPWSETKLMIEAIEIVQKAEYSN